MLNFILLFCCGSNVDQDTYKDPNLVAVAILDLRGLCYLYLAYKPGLAGQNAD